jgi:hypothetical protein
MSQFKAALMRNEENEPAHIRVLSLIAILVFFILGIRKFRQSNMQGREVLKALIYFLAALAVIRQETVLQLIESFFGDREHDPEGVKASSEATTSNAQ